MVTKTKMQMNQVQRYINEFQTKVLTAFIAVPSKFIYLNLVFFNSEWQFLSSKFHFVSDTRPQTESDDEDKG